MGLGTAVHDHRSAVELLNKIYMKLLLSITGILLLAAYPDGAASATPAMFTLHTQPASWNEAHRTCRGKDMTLVLPRTEQLHVALMSYLRIWQNSSLSVDDLWFGLHDSTTGTSPVFFWNDCSPLESTTWTHWGVSEPNNVPYHKCMALSGSSFMWHSFSCMMSKQFICQAPLDSCWYDSILKAELTDTTTDVAAEDEEACAAVCLNYTDAVDGQCRAVTFYADGRCRLLIGQTILGIWDPDVAYTEYAVTKVKRCYWHDINEERPIPNRAFEFFPILSCATSGPKSLVVIPNTFINRNTYSLQNPAPSSSCLLMTTTMTTEVIATPTCPSPSTIIDVSTVRVYSSSVVTEVRTTTEYQLTTRVEYSVELRTQMATVVDVSTVTEYVTATVTQTNTFTETLPVTRIHLITQTVTQVQSQIQVSPMSCLQWMYTSSNDTNTTFEALRLDTRGLSSTRRKSSSAYDARPSAIFVGTVAIGIILGIVGVVLTLDLGTMIRVIKKHHRRRKRRKARMRASN